MEQTALKFALPQKVPLLFLFFSTLLLSYPVFSQDPVRIFLYAGQSNAEGVLTGENNDLFPSSPFDANILYAWNLKGGAVVLNSRWETLKKVPMGSRQITHAGEITVGRALYGAGLEDMGIIKVTKGGTSLNRDWDPRSGNGMYARMRDYVQKKLRELEEEGIPYKLEGIFWHQGEGDTSPSFASQYENNLQEFIEFLRNDFDPNLQVYLASIYNPSRNASDVAKIRDAQQKAVSNNRGVYFVDLDKVYYNSSGGINSDHVGRDGIHYKSAGYLKIGEAFAEVYLANNTIASCSGVIDPQIFNQLSLQITSPSDCGESNARIRIQGNTNGLIFSINGGRDFQASSVFENLGPGAYNLAVSVANEEACQVEFPDNPLVINTPEVPRIAEVLASSPSECGRRDGKIQIEASGENLSYSINGSSYQSRPDFNSLSARAYTVYVRNEASPGCVATRIVNVAFSSTCEEQCSDPVNLALNKPAIQSSTGGDGIAGLANDGNLTGNDNWGADANMQHTEDGLGEWWKVDLGEGARLNWMEIYNRTTQEEGLLNRLSNFYVLSSLSDIDSEKKLEELILDPEISSTFISGAVGNLGKISLGNNPGRYVMIALAGEGPLHMAEVEIYTCQETILEDSTDVTVGNQKNLSQPKNNISWTVFPNPFEKEFRVELNGEQKPVEYLLITNILGKQVGYISQPQAKSISWGDHLPPGTYILQIGVGEFVSYKKLLKI